MRWLCSGPLAEGNWVAYVPQYSYVHVLRCNETKKKIKPLSIKAEIEMNHIVDR